MAITDNLHIVIKVCQMYYEQNLSQKEISARLGISRPQICRMLTAAKDTNVVTIHINNPFIDETRLEHELAVRYGLQDALVVNTNGMDGPARLKEFGRVVAQNLDAYIADKDRVGVMSGQTISSLVRSIQHFNRKKLEVVPLVGGIGSANSDWHANSIAQKLAEVSDGTCCILNAPVMVQSEQAREILVNEPEIAAVLKTGSTCDVTIVGIGQVDDLSTNVMAGGLSHQDVEELLKAGAVASICTSYLNDKGEMIKTDISARSIGQTAQSIKKSRTIALAIGEDKVQAINAVLKGGYADVFITDLDTARRIIDNPITEEERK